MYLFIKRLFDIISSGIAIILLLPLWIIAIIGIEISDPGPVFYIAKRVGIGNKTFCMLKFRSMKVDRCADEKSLRPDQNRIFKWGKIMRDTKIDELPQLLNVFVGQMSVIGPRPASVDQVSITRSGIYSSLNSTKPGLSGPSALYDYIYGDQIVDEAEYCRLVLPNRLKLDLFYLQNRGLKYDAKMIWWTFLSILFHHSRSSILEKLNNSANEIN